MERTMNTYAKCVLTGACFLAGYGLLLWAMRMMNQPDNRLLYTGLAVALALAAVFPAVIRAVWRNR